MAKWLSSNWKVIVTVAGIIAMCAVALENVRRMGPQVELNTQHRLVFEEKVQKIDDDLDDMKNQQKAYHDTSTKTLEQILEEVRK